MSDRTPTPGDGSGQDDPGRTAEASILAKTWFGIRTALGRRGSLTVFGVVTLAYTLGYLIAIGHLTFDGSGVRILTVPSDVLLERFVQARGPYNFEPVALVELGTIKYQFALNTVLGLGVAGLVGLNLAITYLAWRQPAACGVGTSSAGLLAGIPALLSGSACCGPVLLIALGIQATGTLITAFEFLLPLAVVMLLGSLLLVGRRIDPELAARSTAAG